MPYVQVQVPEKSEDVGLFILSVTPPSACNLLKSCSAVCLHAGIFAASLGWTVFAANSYGVVALLALLHPSTRLPPVAVYSVCPSCMLTQQNTLLHQSPSMDDSSFRACLAWSFAPCLLLAEPGLPLTANPGALPLIT